MTENHKTDYWDNLPDGEKTSALKHANLGFGIVLNSGPKWTVKAGEHMLDLNLNSFKNPPSYPPTGTYDTTACDTLAEFHLRNYGLQETKMNAGLSGTIEGITGGASGSTSSSHSKETEKDTKKTTYYMYAEYRVPRIRLELKESEVKLEPEFEKNLRKTLDGMTGSVQELTKIYKLLDDYGWYVATALILGGKLVQTQTVETDSEEDKSKVEDEFEAEFKASVGVPGVFSAEGGGSEHNKQEHEESSKHYKSVSATHRRVVGGSAKGLSGEGLDPWLDSLDDSAEWQAIGREMIPVLSFMPDDLLNKLRAMQKQFGPYETAKRATHIDVFQYFGELEEKAPTGLGGGW